VSSRLANLLIHNKPERGFADLHPGRFLELTGETKALLNDDIEMRVMVTMSNVARALKRWDDQAKWAGQGLALAKEATPKAVGYLSLVMPSLAALPDLESVYSALVEVTGRILDSPEAHHTNSLPEENAIFSLWAPLAWRVVVAAEVSRDVTGESARRLGALARKISDRSAGPGYWSEVATAFEGCAAGVPTPDLVDLANRQSALGRRGLMGLIVSLTLVSQDLSATRAVEAQMMSLACGPGVFFSGAMIRKVIGPYVVRYWTERCRRERFRFSAPSMVEAELRSTGEPDGQALLRLLRTIAFSLGARIPPDLEVLDRLVAKLGVSANA
jgi:hypothetical protein